MNNGVYNASRDIVQLFPYGIGTLATSRLAANALPAALRKYAEFHNVTNEDFVAAAVALREFVNCVTTYDVVDADTAWVKSGLSKLKPPAYLALMASIGEVTAAIFYKTARNATRQGRTVPGASELGALLDQAVSVMRTDVSSAKKKKAKPVADKTKQSILEHDPRPRHRNK